MVPMSSKEIAQKLASLVRLDIDASHAYAEAIERIDMPQVRDEILGFRQDHERHITDLSALIRSLGENPPTYTKDFKGYFIQGFTALRSITGTEGALRAMHTNEQLTNRTYAQAMTWTVPADAKAIIDRNFHDEQRHIEYIEKAIELRIWASKP